MVLEETIFLPPYGDNIISQYGRTGDRTCRNTVVIILQKIVFFCM